MSVVRAKSKVLLVTYSFPPEVGGGGVMRVVKFAKNLKRMGWEPVVLMAKRSDTISPDESLLKEVEGIKIYKSVDCIRGQIRHMLIVITKFRNKLFGTASEYQSKSHMDKKPKEGIITRIKKILYNVFTDIFFIPDETIGWILPAIIMGKKIIRDESIDIILSTSPSFSNHLVGYVLKKQCSKAFVIDYRDKWVGHPINDGYTAWRKKLNRILEGLVINECDHVVTTTEGQAQHFRNMYGKKDIKVILNGFDEDDFDFEEPKVEMTDKLIIGHFGRLTRGRSIRTFVQALEQLDHEILRDVELKLYGNVSEENKTLIRESKASDNMTYLGQRPHLKALKEMFTCNVLLIIQFLEEDGYNAVPAKIFEYFRTRRPVLALCPRGSEVWNIVENNNLGIVVDTNDISGIGEAIVALHSKWKRGTLTKTTISEEILQRFARRKQAEELAEILEEVPSHKE